ncbi:MAG TPA: AMP-binding protein [Nocardioides sp.]|uniref:AMP-binding protein n=1 Tax=Nocardioides sp. TaxID=35761 RepID=UPI002E2F895D|nr:AMP-binding protein [Nocardioides sp.]HEX3930722.1 AMP-binding protein [Nocardioides sp.]
MSGDTTPDAVVLEKRPRSLVHMFLQRVEDTPDADAFYYPVEGGWQESTWTHAHALVEGLAAGLLALGVEPEDRVAMLVSTRYEWVLGYLSTLWAGGAVTAIDPSADDETIARVLGDCGARVVLAEDFETVRTLWRIRADIRTVGKVVQVDGDYPDERVLSLEGLLALGHDHLAANPRALSQRLYAVRRDGLAALAYTRDRDGVLRGARITHAALSYRATAVSMLGRLSRDDLVYLPLPLTSPYAQAVLGVQLATGFALAVEGRAERAVDSMRTVHPTVVTAGVRLLEQIRARAEQQGGDGRLRRRTTERALDVARQVHEARAGDEPVRGRLARQHRSLDRKVLAGVRGLFGQRLRFVVVSGGGVDAELADYLDVVGVTVLEAYGRADSGPVSVALPEDADSRTAGRPIPGTEVAISRDGEIEVRGPGVAEGYHGVRRAGPELLRDGWLPTGDAGLLDSEGRLRVLGRLVRRG